MKYAAVVLRNISISTETVDFGTVANAFLSGGVPLDEIALLPYDNTDTVLATLRRLEQDYDGVFLICDSVLLSAAREAVAAATGKTFGDVLLELENCLFAVLPAGAKGKKLAAEKVIPAIDKRRSQSYLSVVIRTVYAPEDVLLAAVAEAQEEAGEKLVVHYSVEFAVGRIEVVYDRNTPKMLADEVVRILASKLEPYVYAMEDVGISARLFEVLKLHRYKLSTAESFTGGGVGQAIVSNPGASKVFYEGLNTYDSGSKMSRLGVSEYTLKSKGAVSSETAYEMAMGLLRDGHCDIAVSTTGVAGPDFDSSGAPVGLCYIAVGTKEQVRVFEFRLDGDREMIMKTAVNLALFMIYREIG